MMSILMTIPPGGAKTARRRAALALAAAAVFPALGHAASSSWSDGRGARTRLVDGGPAGPALGLPAGTSLGGMEIELAPGAITYWRTPGDAGVPPTFDFSGSRNLAEARVLYPAPSKLDEAGTTAFGYRDRVVFPIVVRPEDPSLPVALHLGLDYAICTTICLPATAKADVLFDGAASTDDTATVREALAAVPSERGLGATGPLRIDAVTRGPDGTATVEAMAPDGAVTLFAEAPDPWYVTASAARREPDGHVGFTLTWPDPRPPGSPPAGPVRLTLTSPSGAIEVAVPLDAILAKP